MEDKIKELETKIKGFVEELAELKEKELTQSYHAGQRFKGTDGDIYTLIRYEVGGGNDVAFMDEEGCYWCGSNSVNDFNHIADDELFSIGFSAMTLIEE